MADEQPLEDSFEVGKPKGASAVTAAIHAALAARYEHNEWILCREVTLGMGSKRCDAVAVNLWPSRSHIVLGFEVKASRTDWLRELNKPSKADDFHQRCHAWWLVTGPSVALKTEIPRGWGWMELAGNGTLIVRVQAEERSEPILDGAFLANLLRRAREGSPHPGAEDLRVAYNRGHDDATKRLKKEAADAVRWDQKNYEALKEKMDAFQKATGTTLESWHRDWPSASRWVLQHGDPDDALREAADRLEQKVKQIRQALADPSKVWGGKQA